MDRHHFPVELTVINHAEYSERFHLNNRTFYFRSGRRRLARNVSGSCLGDGAHCECVRADLDHVKRIVVTDTADLVVHHIWVFPGLRKAAIVPEQRAMVVAKLALLDILRDWVEFLLGRNLFKAQRGQITQSGREDLHLWECEAWDLCQHVE